jgi:kynurenine 3-monooxygenase
MQKIAVVGSGLVGSLLAIYLRRDIPFIYDRSPDIKIQFSGRSINLAMSTRGWSTRWRWCRVREIAIPMDKRHSLG